MKQIKTAEEILKEGIKNKQIELGESPFTDKEFEEHSRQDPHVLDFITRVCDKYADQFKPKWEEFTDNRDDDPDGGEWVIIIDPPEQLTEPQLVKWKTQEVVHGSRWIYLNDIL